MISTQPLFTAIKNECGSLFSTEAHSDSQVLGYIGSAIRYIANYRDFPFLKKPITVTVIAPDTAVTTAFKVKTHTVYFGSQEKIPLPIDEYFTPNTTTQYVGSWDDVFYAKETGTYSVIATIIPAVPTTDTDSIDLPDYLSDVIMTIAMSYAYKSVRMYPESENQLKIGNAILETAANRTSGAYPKNAPVMPYTNPQ